MDEPLISKRTLIITFALTFVTLLAIYIKQNIHSNTTIVFCNVGQGDSSYIRVKNRIDILIDAGAGQRILNCLGKYMPFFDREIELAFITHPDKDHMEGFRHVIDRYKIKTVFVNPLQTETDFSKDIFKKISLNNSQMIFPTKDTKINLLDSQIDFIWPDDEYLASNIRYGEDILGTATVDTNSFSLIFAYQEADINVLYTGDATPLTLSSVANYYKDYIPSPVSILKVPHHGSKNGLTASFLKLAMPTFSVISAGKNNSYGHPADEILRLLSSHDTKILRTDEVGDIVFEIKEGNLIFKE